MLPSMCARPEIRNKRADDDDDVAHSLCIYARPDSFRYILASRARRARRGSRVSQQKFFYYFGMSGVRFEGYTTHTHCTRDLVICDIDGMGLYGGAVAVPPHTHTIVTRKSNIVSKRKCTHTHTRSKYEYMYVYQRKARRLFP